MTKIIQKLIGTFLAVYIQVIIKIMGMGIRPRNYRVSNPTHRPNPISVSEAHIMGDVRAERALPLCSNMSFFITEEGVRSWLGF